jgi:predicted anti-sigma-YlaC factor YlaD
MKCEEFEARISEFLDGTLDRLEASRLREHSLECRACRALVDDVRNIITDCRAKDHPDFPASLDLNLHRIPAAHAPMDCAHYEELITEFLDGFVPASTYHRFEEHASQCDPCSSLLTEVVYAVAACHGVHSYADYAPPDALLDRLVAAGPPRDRRLSRIVAGELRSLVERIIPQPVPVPRPSVTMGLSLAACTLLFLLLGFSDDGTVPGIYRQAELKAGDLYSRGASVYGEKDRVVAELKEVQSDIGEVWKALGGDEAAAGSAAEPGK